MEVLEGMSSKPQIVKQTKKRSKKIVLELNKGYFVPWVLTFIISIIILLYNWYYIETECWNDKYKRISIVVSGLLCLANVLVLKTLCLISCFFDSNTSIAGIRFYTLSFGLICIISIMNLLLAIFMFMQKSCYLMLKVPEDRLIGANLFSTLSIKYDIKLSGALHLSVAAFGFIVSMAFAVIKNNYSYVKQINFQ
jgi:hypothetical protein